MYADFFSFFPFFFTFGQADLKCKEMADGVSTGAASTDELVTAAASALETALAGQKECIELWGIEVCVREQCFQKSSGMSVKKVVVRVLVCVCVFVCRKWGSVRTAQQVT